MWYLPAGAWQNLSFHFFSFAGGSLFFRSPQSFTKALAAAGLPVLRSWGLIPQGQEPCTYLERAASLTAGAYSLNLNSLELVSLVPSVGRRPILPDEHK